MSHQFRWISQSESNQRERQNQQKGCGCGGIRSLDLRRKNMIKTKYAATKKDKKKEEDREKEKKSYKIVYRAMFYKIIGNFEKKCRQ
jgi:hypothetical protein